MNSREMHLLCLQILRESPPSHCTQLCSLTCNTEWGFVTAANFCYWECTHRKHTDQHKEFQWVLLNCTCIAVYLLNLGYHNWYWIILYHSGKLFTVEMFYNSYCTDPVRGLLLWNIQISKCVKFVFQAARISPNEW